MSESHIAKRGTSDRREYNARRRIKLKMMESSNEVGMLAQRASGENKRDLADAEKFLRAAILLFDRAWRRGR